MDRFLERLARAPLLADGAMGTLLYARGAKVGRCLEALVVEQPALVAAIHTEYALAGADLVKTHTFGANRLRLAAHGLESHVAEFNHGAVALACDVRRATGRSFVIAGDVGPVGKAVEWGNPLETQEVEDALGEQIEALTAAGVDLLLFETFSDIRELEVAVAVAKAIREVPVMASLSYGDDGLTLAGQSPAQAVIRLAAAGADVIGANCSTGPLPMIETLRAMRHAAPDAALSVMPNVGLPILDVEGRLHYPTGAEAFAANLAIFLELGACLVGGCCGTTPEHVRALRAALDA